MLLEKGLFTVEPRIKEPMFFLGSLHGFLIEDCAKDGGEEFFTEMHCVRITNL